MARARDSRAGLQKALGLATGNAVEKSSLHQCAIDSLVYRIDPIVQYSFVGTLLESLSTSLGFSSVQSPSETPRNFSRQLASCIAASWMEPSDIS